MEYKNYVFDLYGTLVDIKNKESLMTLTTFSKTIKPKTTISKTVKAEPKTEPAA